MKMKKKRKFNIITFKLLFLSELFVINEATKLQLNMKELHTE